MFGVDQMGFVLPYNLWSFFFLTSCTADWVHRECLEITKAIGWVEGILCFFKSNHGGICGEILRCFAWIRQELSKVSGGGERRASKSCHRFASLNKGGCGGHPSLFTAKIHQQLPEEERRAQI